MLPWIGSNSARLEQHARLNRYRNAFMIVVTAPYKSNAEQDARQNQLLAIPPSARKSYSPSSLNRSFTLETDVLGISTPSTLNTGRSPFFTSLDFDTSLISAQGYQQDVQIMFRSEGNVIEV